MKFKKLLALVLTAALGIGCFAVPEKAALAAGSGLDQDEMSKVILIVKNKLEIGDEYTEFNYDFWEDGSEAYYSFNWNTEDYSKYIGASCDGEGRLTNVYSGNNESKRSLPDKTADEMLPEAMEWLAKIAPEASGHVEKTRSNCSYYNSSYSYTFVRLENGIQMPDNYVQLSVSYKTGELVSANVNWLYDVKIPNAKNLIGKDAAKEKIGTQVKMELQYMLGWETEENGGYYTGRYSGMKEKVFLAYIPSDTYVAVNAKTGKIYQERTYWDRGYDKETAMEEDTADAKAANGASFNATLTEAEIAKIEDLDNIITRDEAIALIRNNDALLIDENLNTFTANLTNDNDKYYWSVSLRDARPADYENGDSYRAYAYAKVAAEDGRIVSFSASVKGLYDYDEDEADNIKLKYKKKDCKKIFEAFAKATDPDKFAGVKLASSNPTEAIRYDYVSNKYTYAGYSFNYTRYYKDIPFYANGINGSVDRITGKIFNYYSNWTDAELPNPKKVIGEEKAFDAYMSYDGFNLVYEIVTDNDKDEQGIYRRSNSVRLVYSTNIFPNYVDAFSGKQLNYSGQEYVPVNNSYSYDDIAGTKYEREITLLAGMGMGVAGSKFRPDDVITKSEFAELAKLLGRYGVSEETGLEGDTKLDRQNAAKEIVTMLGLKKIAELDIYKGTYQDSDKISEGYEGYVALAGALGLIDVKTGETFKPAEGLTRGEAAFMLFAAMKLQIEE
ncbi:MAG: S-layer homology domain-containing protein [Lachnospiraceae bacterium]|nr:S-layer homology domain-containing protein [Lachnospiraceae bacterium]